MAALYVGMLTFQLPNNELLFTVFMLVPDTNVACLPSKALPKAVLSLGCQLKLANDTDFQWFICNNHVVPSYIYKSHTSTSSVSTVVDAVQV